METSLKIKHVTGTKDNSGVGLLSKQDSLLGRYKPHVRIGEYTDKDRKIITQGSPISRETQPPVIVISQYPDVIYRPEAPEENDPVMKEAVACARSLISGLSVSEILVSQLMVIDQFSKLSPRELQGAESLLEIYKAMTDIEDYAVQRLEERELGVSLVESEGLITEEKKDDAIKKIDNISSQLQQEISLQMFTTFDSGVHDRSTEEVVEAMHSVITKHVLESQVDDVFKFVQKLEVAKDSETQVALMTEYIQQLFEDRKKPLIVDTDGLIELVYKFGSIAHDTKLTGLHPFVKFLRDSLRKSEKKNEEDGSVNMEDIDPKKIATVTRIARDYREQLLGYIPMLHGHYEIVPNFKLGGRGGLDEIIWKELGANIGKGVTVHPSKSDALKDIEIAWGSVQPKTLMRNIASNIRKAVIPAVQEGKPVEVKISYVVVKNEETGKNELQIHIRNTESQFPEPIASMKRYAKGAGGYVGTDESTRKGMAHQSDLLEQYYGGRIIAQNGTDEQGIQYAENVVCIPLYEDA